MCSRGVWQLERLVVQYSKRDGASAGLREYMRSNLVDFASSNPQVTIETKFVNNKAPLLIGQYVNGAQKVINVENISANVINKRIQYLRDSSGRKIRKINRNVSTTTPSIQGVWDTSTRFDEFELRV